MISTPAVSAGSALARPVQAPPSDVLQVTPICRTDHREVMVYTHCDGGVPGAPLEPDPVREVANDGHGGLEDGVEGKPNTWFRYQSRAIDNMLFNIRSSKQGFER